MNNGIIKLFIALIITLFLCLVLTPVRAEAVLSLLCHSLANQEKNPEFMYSANNNFGLLPANPAVDSAVIREAYEIFKGRYGLDIEKDIEGRTRPQGDNWDIGAFEYVESQRSQEVLLGGGDYETWTNSL